MPINIRDHEWEDFCHHIQQYMRVDYYRMRDFFTKLRGVYINEAYAGLPYKPVCALCNIPARYRGMFLAELDLESQKILAEQKRKIAFAEGRIDGAKAFTDLMKPAA